MTAPFLTLAQILNRLTVTARRTLREHHPGPDGRCPLCRTPDCAVAAAARDVLDTINLPRWLPLDRAPGGPER
ncbi:hypothetical protein GCM10011608_07160 [Micromonospora sonchi]|uniref:Uncharacterized protein n=1 Tax=Micromonospora sonchi TaxID=1763543 RepID=A0A917WSC8_9ACTN|nr:hypothetical protein [Micromonospora sonchi]GGM24884.1 hypothetical protein GCM10011608_07160 [Micromonospora sonchi]